MNTKELENWVFKNNIIERTEVGFWKYIKNYENEEPREFLDVFGNIDLKLVKLNISKVNLTINYQFDEPIEYVCAFMNIEYEGEVIGFYELVFTLDGDDLDDYLRIEE